MVMSTNYYFQNKPCSHCGFIDDNSILHIGKGSGGWCFALHVMPEEGIETLDDWKRLLEDPDKEIVDEYGDKIEREKMLQIITQRSWPRRPEEYGPYSEPGPNNLHRHKLHPGFCIGHGEGTWDYMVGEFS